MGNANQIRNMFIAAVLLLVPLSAMAAVAPFGFAVGEDTIDEVRAGLERMTTVEAAGINKYSHGPMLRADGTGMNFEGLETALFIFNQDKVLCGVVLTLGKYRFDAIVSYLDQKYDSVSRDIPFVGNSSVTYRAGNIEIRANAPHMSFEMTVTYLTQAFLAAYKHQSGAEERRQQKRERSKL